MGVLAEELTKQLQEVQAERDELAIADRVLNRLSEQAQAALRGCRSGIGEEGRTRRPRPAAQMP